MIVSKTSCKFFFSRLFPCTVKIIGNTPPKHITRGKPARKNESHEARAMMPRKRPSKLTKRPPSQYGLASLST